MNQATVSSATLDRKKQRADDTVRQVSEIKRVTLWGLVGNIALAALKFAFGIIGSCQALVADAVHSLSDSTTDIAVIVGSSYWSAPADHEHPHGHGRIETLITFFIGVVLAVVGVGLVCNALSTMQQPHASTPGWLALLAACVSMVSKELLYRWTVATGRRVKSSALIANAWHHRSDGLSSLPVAIAVLGSQLYPQLVYLDHVAAVIVSCLILHAAWKISWPALKQLVDAGAGEEERQVITAIIMSNPDVKQVHALRTRNIGSGLQVDFHLLVAPDLSVYKGHVISGIVKDAILREGPDVVDVLIHVEPYEP
jgi:cation diffusion facilitator family transporter